MKPIKPLLMRNASATNDPFFSNVTALLHFNGADASTSFPDNSPIAATYTATGFAQVDTSQSKFGGASAIFDFSQAPCFISTSYSTTNYNWWAQDQTIEMWVYAPSSWLTWSYSLGGATVIPVAIGNRSASTTVAYWAFGPINGGQVRFYYFNGSAQLDLISTGTLTVDTWHHIAFTNNAGTLKLWLDGVGDTSLAIVGTPQSDTGVPLVIGQGNGTCPTGWIDDLRITKGVARYTANFTPPTAQFPDS